MEDYWRRIFQQQLDEQGYEIAWPTEDRLELKKQEGWQVMIEEEKGKKYILKVAAKIPANHIL